MTVKGSSILKKIIKYFAYTALGIFILITGVAALTLFLFNTGWGKDRIVGIANYYSPVQIKLGDLSLNVFKGKIELKGLEIYDGDNVKMGSIGYFGIGVRYRPMFSGMYVVDSLIIADVDISVSANQLESFRSDKSAGKKAEPDTAKAELDLIVKNFEIRGIAAQFIDEASNSEYALRNKNIKASADVKNMIFSLLIEGTEADIKTPELKRTVKNERFDLRIESDKAVIGETRFVTEGLDLSLGGSVSNLFAIPFFDLRFAADIETEKLLDRMEAFAKDNGMLNIAGSVMGEAEYPQADFTVKHGKGVLFAQKIEKLEILASYKDKVLNLDAGISKSEKERFTIDGSVDISEAFSEGLITSEPELNKTSYDLMVNAEDFSLSNIPGMPDAVFDFGLELKGRGVKPEEIKADAVVNTEISPFSFDKFSLRENARLFADINWDRGKFTVLTDIRTGSLSWDNYEISSLFISGGANDKGSVEIKKLTVMMDSSIVDIAGKAVLFGKNFAPVKDPRIDVSVKAQNIRTERFYPEISTHVDLSAFASGKLSEVKGGCELITGAIDYQGVSIDSVGLKAGIKGRDILIDRLSVYGGGSEITINGKVSGNNRFDAVIRTEGLILDSIYSGIKGKMSAAADLSISAGGTFDDPEVEGSIKLKKITASGMELPDITSKINLKSMIFGIEADAGVHLSAGADLNKKKYEAKLLFSTWDFSHLIPENADGYFSGMVSGEVRASGNYEKIEDYDSEISLDSLEFKADGRKIVHGGGVELQFSKGALDIKNFGLKLLDDGYFSVSGGLGIEGKADLNSELSLPLSSLSFLMPEISGAEGYLRGKLKADGDIKEPLITGTLTFDKTGVILPVTEQKLHSLSGDVLFSRDKISVRDLSGNIERGTFSVRAEIAMKAAVPENIELDIRTAALPFTYPDNLDGQVNSNISYRGTPKKGRLSGNVEILEALYYKDLDLFKNIGGAGGPKIVQAEKKDDGTPDISLDIALSSRRPLVMDNDLGFIELVPDLQILGTVSSPLISGRAAIQKDGFIMFQKNSFIINRGILDFEPVHGALPTADVQSETKINNYRIFLSISENLANPKFSLTSIPAESDADILSILLFGRKASELSGVTGGAGLSREKMIADWLAGAYSQGLAKKTGLDYIQLSVPDNFSAKEPAGYGLTVGKKISDRLIIKYSMVNSGSELIQRASADYQMFENIIFSGFQSSDGKFGAETQYRMEFR